MAVGDMACGCGQPGCDGGVTCEWLTYCAYAASTEVVELTLIYFGLEAIRLRSEAAVEIWINDHSIISAV
jgi:hypothetical protein